MSWLGEGLDSLGKAIGAVKDFPLWLLIGLAAAADILLLVPYSSAAMPLSFGWWLWVAVVVCNVLAISRAISVGHRVWFDIRAATAARRTFHMTPIDGQSFWSMSKQADDSTTTQINAHIFVKNLTTASIGLAAVRMIHPKIHGDVLHSDVMVRASDCNMYGTAIHSGHQIPASEALPASINLIIRGVPKMDAVEKLSVVLGVADDEGNEQRIKLALRGLSSGPRQASTAIVAPEPGYAIDDPIAKDVASVLRSELDRYSKCGRERGGLGSVHMVYRGRPMVGFAAGDGWDPTSPRNQAIAEDPEKATLLSDNLDALLTRYRRLLDDQERARFVEALTSRLNERSSYLRVSYFIVYALWAVGNFKEALRVAKELPVGDIKTFGLSNILLMLNGLLRYRHPDFTDEMLDEIESFIHGLNESTFQIEEKIASIRTYRLLRGTDGPGCESA